MKRRSGMAGSQQGEEELLSGLAATSYIYDRTHQLLACDAHKPAGPNIGWDGSNLTIAFLSLGSVEFSLRLLESIKRHMPAFKGEILVVDIGSREADLRKLRTTGDTVPYRMRVVEIDCNHSVASARNQTMRQVRSEWVLLADTCSYFLTNPLEMIQRDIGVLGSHFLNLPLLNADGEAIVSLGGHLYAGVEGGDVYVGADSAYHQTVKTRDRFEPFLSTLLIGRACVLNKETFEWVGGYDERVSGGVEDVDLSIRIFQRGLKIGNGGFFSLACDDSYPDSAADLEGGESHRERQAFQGSAAYLETKLGVRVWEKAAQEWSALQERRLRASTQSHSENLTQGERQGRNEVANLRRPRVALLVDTDSWAFWNISQQLCRHLSEAFDFRVIPTAVLGNVIQVLLAARDCDIVHIFWREYVRQLESPQSRIYVEWLGGNYDEFLRDVLKRPVLSTGIYDHLWLDEASLRERLPVYRDLLDAYYVCSERLFEIYRNIRDYPDPVMVLEDGVDPELFYPVGLDRFDNTAGREIVIGWAGNSTWSSEFGDFKGVRTILKPAVEQLRSEGAPLRLELADRAESPLIPHDEMVNYYAKIDLYVCTSEIEGTPNPVLESMACGVPVISTDVGVVSEAFGARQRRFVLEQRSVESLKQAIRRLVSEPRLFRELSAENLMSIRDWFWERRVQGFREYFQKCLEAKAAGCGVK